MNNSNLQVISFATQGVIDKNPYAWTIFCMNLYEVGPHQVILLPPLREASSTMVDEAPKVTCEY